MLTSCRRVPHTGAQGGDVPASVTTGMNTTIAAGRRRTWAGPPAQADEREPRSLRAAASARRLRRHHGGAGSGARQGYSATVDALVAGLSQPTGRRRHRLPALTPRGRLPAVEDDGPAAGAPCSWPRGQTVASPTGARPHVATTNRCARSWLPLQATSRPRCRRSVPLVHVRQNQLFRTLGRRLRQLDPGGRHRPAMLIWLDASSTRRPIRTRTSRAS